MTRSDVLSFVFLLLSVFVAHTLKTEAIQPSTNESGASLASACKRLSTFTFWFLNPPHYHTPLRPPSPPSQAEHFPRFRSHPPSRWDAKDAQLPGVGLATASSAVSRRGHCWSRAASTSPPCLPALCFLPPACLDAACTLLVPWWAPRLLPACPRTATQGLSLPAPAPPPPCPLPTSHRRIYVGGIYRAQLKGPGCSCSVPMLVSTASCRRAEATCMSLVDNPLHLMLTRLVCKWQGMAAAVLIFYYIFFFLVPRLFVSGCLFFVCFISFFLSRYLVSSSENFASWSFSIS